MHLKVYVKSQIGRSFVEMLGVLAIIGILTIGGLVGYRMAITKYKANETLSEISARTVMLSAQMLTKIHILNMDEMGYKTKLGYPVSARISPKYKDYFEIFVDDIEPAVCREMLSATWRVPASIFVGTSIYEGDVSICNQAEDGVQMIYEFKDDLTDQDAINPDDKHDFDRCNNASDCKCGDCHDGICESYCTGNTSCVKSFEDFRWYVCCKKENIINGMCCAFIDKGMCCNMTGTCCPSDKPLVSKGGECLSCNDAGNYYTFATREECSKCPNRIYGFNNNDKCMLPCDMPGTYTEGKKLPNIDGICYDCNTSERIWLGYWGDKNRCFTLCPQRILDGDYCYLKTCSTERPLMDTNNNCYDCQSERTNLMVGIDGSCEDVCPNRQANGNYCILKECANGFVGANGGCYSCDEAASIDVLNVTENCNVCPERYLIQNRYCAKICASDMFQSREGNCYSCEYNGLIYTTYNDPSECQKCSDREFFMPDRCFLACGRPGTLNEKKPLADGEGKCHACEEKQDIVLNYGDTTRCTTICPERKLKGNLCILEDNCKGFRNTSGQCKSCEDTGNYYTYATLEECSKCPNRIHGFNNNDKCMLPCDMPGTYTEGKVLANIDGICYDCNDPKRINMGFWGDNNRCALLCPNRYLDGTYCIRSSCSENMRLEDKDGICYPCNIGVPIDVQGDLEKCGKCINRRLEGKNCVLK